MRDLISQVLGTGENIAVGFFKLRSPELSSLAAINQFQVQMQMVIAPNYLSCRDHINSQISTCYARIQILLAMSLDRTVCQHPHFQSPRHAVDDSFDNAFV